MPKKITVYSPAELHKKNPEAFERAKERFIQDECNAFGVPWQDEIMDSLKAIYKHSGIELKDWSISGDCPSQSDVRLEFPYGYGAGEQEVRDLSGQRALAWIENNLLSKFRIKDNSMQKYNKGYPKGFRPYSIGNVKPCPFTGYCADDEFIDALLKSVKSGDTLGEAYSNLAYVAGKMFENEYRNMWDDEYFEIQDQITLTIDGQII